MYASTMAAAGAGFMQTASALLQAPAQLEFEGANDEFGRRLCDTMSVFGQQHVNGFEHRAAFMQQVRTLVPLPSTAPHSLIRLLLLCDHAVALRHELHV